MDDFPVPDHAEHCSFEIRAGPQRGIVLRWSCPPTSNPVYRNHIPAIRSTFHMLAAEVESGFSGTPCPTQCLVRRRFINSIGPEPRVPGCRPSK